jgi:hypothetical protein
VLSTDDQLLNFGRRVVPGNGNFNGIDLGTANAGYLFLFGAVGNVDLDEQQQLPLGVGKQNIGLADEIHLTGLLDYLALDFFHQQCAVGAFKKALLRQHLISVDRVARAKLSNRAKVAFESPRVNGGHLDPAQPGQDDFGLFVAVGLLGVVATPLRRVIPHLMPEMSLVEPFGDKEDRGTAATAGVR